MGKEIRQYSNNELGRYTEKRAHILESLSKFDQFIRDFLLKNPQSELAEKREKEASKRMPTLLIIHSQIHHLQDLLNELESLPTNVQHIQTARDRLDALDLKYSSDPNGKMNGGRKIPTQMEDSNSISYTQELTQGRALVERTSDLLKPDGMPKSDLDQLDLVLNEINSYLEHVFLTDQRSNILDIGYVLGKMRIMRKLADKIIQFEERRLKRGHSDTHPLSQKKWTEATMGIELTRGQVCGNLSTHYEGFKDLLAFVSDDELYAERTRLSNAINTLKEKISSLKSHGILGNLRRKFSKEDSNDIQLKIKNLQSMIKILDEIINQKMRLDAEVESSSEDRVECSAKKRR